VPRLLEPLQQSSFIQRFSAKGRFTSYLQEIPVYVITDEYPAFSGAANALDDIYDHIGVSYRANQG
jgi:glucokinase